MGGKIRSGIVAMIPARIGSERLRQKNLLMLGDKPVLAHAITTAQQSGVFDRVIVNGDDPIFERIAASAGAEFYLRPPELGSSDARSDDVVADFMEKNPVKIVTWVNSASPLQPPSDVIAAVRHFEAENLDSLITTRREGFHALFKGQPINFEVQGKFARTQDLPPVSIFVYSVMMWRSSVFLEHYHKHGHAVIVGKFGTYDVSPAACMLLKTDENFATIEAAYARQKAGERSSPRYFS